MHLGIWEIAIILVVAMLFFGPKRVSDLGTALGQSIRGFKKGLSGEDEVKPATAVAKDGPQPPTTPAV